MMVLRDSYDTNSLGLDYSANPYDVASGNL